MPTVGLLINETKPPAVEAANRLTDVLRGRDVRVLTREMIARQMRGDGLYSTASDAEIARSDFVVVFGGDGTLLSAARLVAPYGTPLLGVHLGHFGFITEVAPEELLSAVDSALAGSCKIEERLLLMGTIHRGGDSPEGGTSGNGRTNGKEEKLLAINDIVAASGAVRMVHVRTTIGDDLLATYAADGVIVSSPTGSTAYSLSAGGPLVHPSAPVLIVTPICPHTLNARTLIVPDTETVHLTIERQTRDVVVVSVDGQVDIPLHPGDTISISRAPYNLRLLSVGGPNFYQKIRSRWHFGERSLG